MLRYKIITLIMLLAGLTLASNFRVSAQQVSEGQRLAMYTKPSVVRILDGYIGTAYWPENGGKVFTMQLVGSGSGSFIDPNGYIATNAHVTDLTHQGDDKGKQLLFYDFVKQLSQYYGKDPRAIMNSSEPWLIYKTTGSRASSNTFITSYCLTVKPSRSRSKRSAHPLAKAKTFP